MSKQEWIFNIDGKRWVITRAGARKYVLYLWMRSEWTWDSFGTFRSRASALRELKEITGFGG